MPNKAVIQIDVDDSAFKRFSDLFDTYTAKLDEQPEAYKRLEEAMGGATDTMREGAVSSKEAFAAAAAQAGLISEAILHAGRAQNEFNRSTNTANRGLSGLAKTAHGLGQTIFGIATSVLKIGAEGLGLGALASIGSFFGLGGLAKTAFDRQKDASGLGISTGRLTAFKDDAQDLLGVGALQATVNAQRDIKSTGSFARMGIDFNKAQTQDPIALAFDELQAAGRGFMAARKAGLPPAQNYAVQGYIALGGDMNDVQRVASRQGMARLQRDRASINRDSPGFEMGGVGGLIEFKKQLDRAGDAITTDLIKTMGPLAPVLTDLSKDLVGLAGEVIGNKDVQKAVKDASQGLADFLTQTNWNEVGRDLQTFGNILHNVAGALGFIITGAKKPGTPAEKAAAAAETAKWGGSIGDIDNKVKDFPKFLADEGKKPFGFLGDAASAVFNVAKKYTVDPILAIATAIQESGLDPKAVGDRGTSFGLFQLHQGGELGDMSKDQAFDPSLNARTAIAEIARVKKAHPNWSAGRIAAAAQRPEDQSAYAKGVNHLYNEIVADIAKYGKNWGSHLPKDVDPKYRSAQGGISSSDLSKHAKAITAASRAKQTVAVNVTAPPGWSAASSANAASF